MIILLDAENIFEKFPHCLMINVQERLVDMGTHLNITKAIYNKPTANIILNGEKLKTCLVR